jgi:hypothetical protein
MRIAEDGFFGEAVRSSLENQENLESIHSRLVDFADMKKIAEVITQIILGRFR